MSAKPSSRPVVQETPLSRALSGCGPTAKATPVDAFKVARTWFLEGRRVDMQQLAETLGVSRATLYRWCGNREQLLGEVIWALTEEQLNRTRSKVQGSGLGYVTEVIGTCIAKFRTSKNLRRLLSDDPEYALRLMTSKHGIVQGRMIDWCAELLSSLNLRPDLDLPDLSYVIVRICESFVWSDLITGAEPETEKAVVIIELLLGAAQVAD
ncbi:QsdR family transcriptional regulator [Crossiella cryophila]|uniref:AcrR family transcriptional regulator n=1 Tax=Crossiella cryophila TaxID=43355 RepID=A0A7W7CBM9_9PSEU|nr:QsdR family transcriptional regulator [Crossiella cryophila]MBB4678192.1 AcrR family transcriptional regulator [Crossiella cryophila]